MKKWLSFFAALALFAVVCMSPCAVATSPSAMEFDTALAGTLNEDGTVTLRLSVTDCRAPLQGLIARLYYDADALTLITPFTDEKTVDCMEQVPDDNWENLTSVKTDERGTYIAVNVCVTVGSSVISDETPLVLSFCFLPKEGIGHTLFALPTAYIEGIDSDINYRYGNGTELNVDLYQNGDCNGDCLVDSTDVTVLLRYLACRNDETEDAFAEITRGADVNGDGKINGKDAVRLLRYFADSAPLANDAADVRNGSV